MAGWRRWILLLTASLLAVAAAWWLKAPCAEPARWNGQFEYSSFCYNEFVPLWSARGFNRGLTPYIEATFEYPALSGAAAMLANRGGGGARGFFDRMAILLALASLISVVAFAEARGGPDWRAFVYALAPPTVLYLFQNFDQIAVAAMMLGILALRRQRLAWAGVAFGVGAGVKLFPGLVALGAAIAILGQRRARDAIWIGAAAALTFVAANLPFVIANAPGWWGTYAFHGSRVADWGSILFWLSNHAGWKLSTVSRVGDWVSALGFVALLGALAVRCRRRPMDPVQAGAFVLVIFLLTNKVWSPQYALWILPFLVMFELPLGWLVIFSAIECGELAGKFEWFAGAGGVNVTTGWTALFEIMVWARFVFTALFAIRLFRAAAGEPSLSREVEPSEPNRKREAYRTALAPESQQVAARWRWRGGVVLLVTAIVILARIGDPSLYVGANSPPNYVHDECYQAFTAHRYAAGDPNAWSPRASRDVMKRFDAADMTAATMYEWVHPPGAKLVMALLIRLLGFRPIAYRFGSFIFGLLLLFSTWRLAARLCGEQFGVIAVLLLGVEGLTFTMSRIAMNDIYAVACLVPATFGVYRYWVDRDRRRRWLVAAGAAFGLGLTMKWSVLPLFIECAFLTVARIAHDARRSGNRQLFVRDLVAWAAGFVVAPVAIYLIAYVPYFWAGHSFSDFADLVHQQRWYHEHLNAVHSYGSRWYGWPLILRPVWFYAHSAGPESIAVIYAMGNPLVWWVFLPSLAWIGWRFACRRAAADGLILLGFFGSWLPWMFVSRVGFIQYLLPAVPFGVLAVASAVSELARFPRGRLIAGIYILCCVAAFIYFYPIWSAWPISTHALSSHRWIWFNRWR